MTGLGSPSESLSPIIKDKPSLIHAGMSQIRTAQGCLPTYIADATRLPPTQRRAAQNAAKLRVRLDACKDAKSICETFNSVFGLMEQTERGILGVPVDATGMMRTNDKYSIKGNSIGGQKIETACKSSGTLEITDAHEVTSRITLSSDLGPNYNLHVTINDRKNEPKEFNIDKITSQPPTKEQEEAIALIKGLASLMADGEAAATAVTKIHGSPDIIIDTATQRSRAEKLAAAFEKIGNRFDPVQDQDMWPYLEVPEVPEPLTGFNSAVGAVLAGLQTEWKNRTEKSYTDKSGLVTDFIAYVQEQRLQPTLDSIWKQTREFTEDDPVQRSRYITFTDQAFSSEVLVKMGVASIGELGERKPEYDKLFSVFKALRATMIALKVASEDPKYGNSYPPWINDEYSSAFADLAIAVLPADRNDGEVIRSKAHELSRGAAYHTGRILLVEDDNKYLDTKLKLLDSL